jgi:beta-barrel assembly-enhancing protease
VDRGPRAVRRWAWAGARVTGPALLAVALLSSAGCTVNPVTGKQQLDLMGEAQELEMGRQYYPGAIQGSLGPVEDEALQAEVRRVGNAVAAVGQRPQLPWEFTAVNDPQVNAFALPGGKICITRGLVARLESEDGMAAVLGHETGHVTARHAVSAYNRQILTTAVIVGGGIAMEAADVKHAELITLGAVVGAQIMLAQYSRDQERQADELGLDYAVKAGYSPEGMVETHKVLLALQKSKPGAVERLFASHPMSAERLATAEARVAAMPAEVRERPLRVAPYREAAGRVIAAKPAWDLAADAQALLSAKKYGEAEGKLAEAVRLAPGEGVLRTLHAASLAALKREGAALAEGREGAGLAPSVYVSQAVAGELLLRPDPAAALARLDRAETLLSGVAEVALMRGRALESLKRREEAVTAYRQAVERDPQGETGAAAAQRLRSLGVALQ